MTEVPLHHRVFLCLQVELHGNVLMETKLFIYLFLISQSYFMVLKPVNHGCLCEVLQFLYDQNQKHRHTNTVLRLCCFVFPLLLNIWLMHVIFFSPRPLLFANFSLSYNSSSCPPLSVELVQSYEMFFSCSCFYWVTWETRCWSFV